MAISATILALTLVCAVVICTEPMLLTEACPMMLESWSMKANLKSHGNRQIEGINVTGVYAFGVGETYDDSWASGKWVVESQTHPSIEILLSIFPSENATYQESRGRCTAVEGAYVPFHPDRTNDVFKYNRTDDNVAVFNLVGDTQFMTATIKDGFMDIFVDLDTGLIDLINTTVVEYFPYDMVQGVDEEMNARPPACQAILDAQEEKKRAAMEDESIVVDDDEEGEHHEEL